MPREIVKKPRFIYPQIATSLSIAKLSVLAELLFWRILPQADDQGRLPGDPLQLKATVCPIRKEFTDDNITELLTELEDARLIIHYSNSSIDYIQIAKWWDYQGSMRRIFPSQYPPPEGWQDRIKGVSGGQTPTNADKQHPEEEEEVEEEREKELETRIGEEEEEEKTTTATTETAIESKSLETHEGSKRATETAKESKMLGFLETLEGWRFRRVDDLAWLREFCRDWPDFDLSLAKACRDYYSGQPPPKNKGPWKNRFRQWMIHERDFGKAQSGKKGAKSGGTHKQDDKEPSAERYQRGLE